MKTTPPILLLLLASASFLPGQETAKKLPVPADAAQAEATKLVKEVYGDEYAKAKTTADKQVLAKKLLGKANETQDDPVSKYVLLKLSRDIATQATDGQTAFQAIDGMVESFQVDALEMKAATLTTFGGVATTSVQHRDIAQQAMSLITKALSNDNFTVANELDQLALGEARKAREKGLATQIQRQIDEISQAARAYEEVKTAKLALEKTPDDPDANLVVGKYECVFKDDWDKGVPMLALCKDEAFKRVAMQELEGAASSSEQAKLGDGWWELAEKQEGTAKTRIQSRAGYWY